MGHSGAHHPIRREWAKKIVVDSCILCPNQEKKELCYLFCQNHRKHLPRHRAIPLSIRIRHPHLTTKLQSGPVMSEPGNARELESSEKVLQMWGTLIPYKPFHFVQHKDMPQNCLSSAEWLSCLDLQSPEGKTNTMTTTVTPAEHKAWFSTMDRERERDREGGQIPSPGIRFQPWFLEVKKSTDGERSGWGVEGHGVEGGPPMVLDGICRDPPHASQ